MAAPVTTVAVPQGQQPQQGQRLRARIVDVRFVPSMDPRRVGQYDALVVVQVGEPPNVRVYTLRVPREKLEDTKFLAEEIRKLLREEMKHIGREFEITL